MSNHCNEGISSFYQAHIGPNLGEFSLWSLGNGMWDLVAESRTSSHLSNKIQIYISKLNVTKLSASNDF